MLKLILNEEELEDAALEASEEETEEVTSDTSEEEETTIDNKEENTEENAEVEVEVTETEKTDDEEFAKQDEFDEYTQKTGSKEAINILTKDFWDLISHVESIIATFKFDVKEDSKEDILDILEGVMDDLTINLGMLSKVSSLIDSEDTAKTVELMAKGEEKADKIINEK